MSARARRLDPGVELIPRLDSGASVKVIGLGGVGSIVSRYLALFLRSLGENVRMVLVDGDAFEPGNATRMAFLEEGNKAEVVRDELLELLGDSCVTLGAVPSFVTGDNIPMLIRDGDIVILAVDNHATRNLVNEHCRSRLRDVCLVSGGNDGLEELADGRTLRGTYGNCQVYVKRAGEERTPSLTYLHPEIEQPADQVPGGPDCTELAQSVPQILFANLMVASSILNALFLHLCGALHYGEVCFDLADALMQPMPLPEPRTAGPAHAVGGSAP